jgi:hypothetical protein
MKKHGKFLLALLLLATICLACNNNVQHEYCTSPSVGACPSKKTVADIWVGKHIQGDWGITLSVDDGPTLKSSNCCYTITAEPGTGG